MPIQPSWNEFLKTRTVKEFNPLRKTNVPLKEVVNFLITEYNLRYVGGCGLSDKYEQFYYANDEKDIRVAFHVPNLPALPILAISVSTDKDWFEIRDLLIERGYARAKQKRGAYR